MTTAEVVAALGQAIARRIGEPRYNLWFGRNTRFSWEEGLLVVGVPNHFFQEWLQKTFADAVRAAATETLGRPMQVRFAIDPELFQAARRAQEEIRVAPRQAEINSAWDQDTETGDVPEPRAPEPPRRVRRWRRLADFVVGSCNRVAHAAALNLVETPDVLTGPLVFHGPVGTGKTHLLEGIYAGLRRRRPSWRVCFIPCEDFTNRFVQALRTGKLGVFRKHFRDCDALLIDDLQFLARKRATREEFLHTLDALQADGRPVVVTCDLHPRLADAFTPELTDRLLGGAVWGLVPPDEDTRLAILRAKAPRDGGPIPDEVLRHLAALLRGNVRELEGALAGLRHYSRVVGRPIDLGLARQALGDHLRHAVRTLRLEDVDRSVCHVLGLDPGALRSRQRTWAVSHARMLAMYLARKHTAAAYSEIGRYFGGRNHSTALAAEKRIREGLQDDLSFVAGEPNTRLRDVVERVERELLR